MNALGKSGTRVAGRFLVIGLPVGSLVALIAVYIVVGLYQESVARERLTPPDHVTSIEELRGHLPYESHTDRIAVDGLTYTVLWVRYDGVQFAWLPSGPPAYVYDAEGELVMWRHETGEGDDVSAFILSGAPIES